ncbi:hypothetical protein Tco_0626432, partial [Tanacetum coccineum]
MNHQVDARNVRPWHSANFPNVDNASSESYINTLLTSSISNIHLNPFHNKRKDNKYQRRMQTANTAASIKETTTNI